MPAPFAFFCQFWLKNRETLVTNYYGFIFSVKKSWPWQFHKKMLYKITTFTLFSLPLFCLNQVTKKFSTLWMIRNYDDFQFFYFIGFSLMYKDNYQWGFLQKYRNLKSQLSPLHTTFQYWKLAEWFWIILYSFKFLALRIWRLWSCLLT